MIDRRVLSPSALGLAGLALAYSAPAAAQDETVASRLEAEGIKYTVDAEGDFKVTYNYSKEGRTQLVFISGKTETVSGLTIREVFSPAARITKDGIDAAKAFELIQESGRLKLGAWEVRGDALYLVIKVIDTLSSADLEAVMDIAAETADDKEIEISGDRDDL